MKSFSEYLKAAEFNFLCQASNLINSKQNYIKCKVQHGVSMSFLDYDGVDINDIPLTGYVSLIAMDMYTTKVVLNYSSPYYGKGEVSNEYKVGDLTANLLCTLVLGLVGGNIPAHKKNCLKLDLV